MIQLKIGCIKINVLQDCSCVNIGTSINMQNKSHTENNTYEKPQESIPEPRPERPEERPEQPVRPPVTPPRPGPIGPP
jgi:hypothetical protein